jgi:hypothetical protein
MSTSCSQRPAAGVIPTVAALPVRGRKVDARTLYQAGFSVRSYDANGALLEGGTLLYEVADGIHFKWTPLKGFTDYGPFDISPELPHGYAHRIGSPEGDDDSPFLDVTPGTKLNVRE